jgi:hypothetical protein
MEFLERVGEVGGVSAACLREKSMIDEIGDVHLIDRSGSTAIATNLPEYRHE